MPPDQELLRRYAESRDDAAFAELVRRYVNLVYATALRLTNGRAALAEEASQAAFIDLARKADRLCHHPALAGWLHTSVRFAASKTLRAEHLRHQHEQAAAKMTDFETSEPDAAWAQIRPLLDEAIGRLKEPEREAVLLRFFQDKNYREVGELLGLSENTARMRVERALEKLRAQFGRRGVVATAALLTTALGAEAATVTPASVTAKITTSALASPPPAKSSLIRLVWAWPVVAVLLLVVGVCLLLQSRWREQQISTAIPPTTVAPPTVGAAQIQGQKTSTARNNFGTINVLAAEPLPLDTGRIFSVEAERQADGTLHLVYGVFDADKFSEPDLAVAVTKEDPNTNLALNEYHSQMATPDLPVFLSLADGETLSFTPTAKPWTVNQLGDVYLPDEAVHTLAAKSGKIIALSHPLGRPLDIKFYLSAADYATGKPALSSTWVPAVDNHPVQEWLDDDELIVFTPHY